MRPALILTLLCCALSIVFAQRGERSTLDKVRSLSSQNPQKAFALLQRIRHQARVNHDTITELECLDILGTASDALSPAQQRQIASWLKQGLAEVRPDLTAAQLHYHLGNVYTNQPGGADSARYHFNLALTIRLAFLPGNSELIAACYHGLGDVYKYITGDYELAVTCYETALQIRENLVPVDTLVLARNYYNLATTNRSRGDYEKALSYGLTTIQLSNSIGHHAMLEQANTIVANIYRDMHQSALAREFYRRAIALNSSAGKSMGTLAWNYVGIGQTNLNDSLLDAAIGSFNTAMPLFGQLEKKGTMTEDIRNLWIYGQVKLAEAYVRKGEHKQAELTFRSHFSTLKRLNIVTGKIVAESLAGYGDYHFSIRQYDSAIYYYQKALTQALSEFHPSNSVINPTEVVIGDKFYVYEILSRKAKVFQRWYQDSRNTKYLWLALEGFELSEKMMSRQRNTMDMQESKWEFLDTHFNLYEELLWCLDALYHHQPSDSVLAKVFTYVERSKARTLNDVLDEGISNPIVRQQNSFQRSWFSVLNALYKEQSKSMRDSNKITSLRMQLIELDRQRKQNEEEMKKRYPGYFKAKINPVASSVGEVKQFLRTNERVVLEYFFGNESVYALGMDGQTMLFRRLGSADSIQRFIEKLLIHFGDDHSSSSIEAYTNFTRSSYMLYQLLVHPFRDILSGVQYVQIIPDGSISQVPFEVLISEQPSQRGVNYWRLQYAVRHYSIGYAYSTTVLVTNHSHSIKSPSLLAMGFSGGVSRDAGEKFADLGGSLREVDILKKYFVRGKFLMGNEASKENFKVLSPEYDIIHLAIHGQGDRQNPFSSSLFFRTVQDTLEEGQLHAFELYGMQLKATLAVLTACESGLGKAYKGEGMMSIATAFSYSGCQNTLMSLWNVHDQASVGLMSVFYENILEGERIDDALTIAKLNYLEHADEISADPKIWAPMVAYGSLNSVVDKNKSSTIVFSAFLTATVLLLVFRGRGLFKRLTARRS